MDPITVSMGLGLFAAGGGLGWWLTKTHESLDGLGDGMILLQEAQASASAMMGKRMDGLETSIQRLVAGLDGVRAAHPELDGTILAYEALHGQGEAIAAFVSLIGTDQGDENLISELRQHVSDKIGPIAKPKSIVITADLPKTRSGKIMRRLLKDISEERKLGDVTTLANADIVSELQSRAIDSDDE